MTYKQTTGNPLVNSHADHLSKGKYTWLFFVESFSLINSLKEESLEGLKRVLIHMVDDVQTKEQEVKCGTFSSNTSVCLTELVDSCFSLLSFQLLALNFSRSSLSYFKRFNKRDVCQNGVGVSIRQILEQIRLKLSKSGDELILFVN